MVNPFKEVNWWPGLPERRKFAMSLIIGFPCIALLLFLGRGIFTHHWVPEPSLWLGGIGCTCGVVFWLIPGVALPFYQVWYFVSCCIGIVISNLLFIGFYYTVVLGTGLLLRILGRTPVSKGGSKSAVSYWHDAEEVADVKRYYRQF